VRSTHDATRRRAPGLLDVRGIANDSDVLLLAFLIGVAASGCPQLKDDDFSSPQLHPQVDAGEWPTDVSPPRIVSSTPANGATGVPSDVVIEITFSKAMDEKLTEAAYSSAKMPSQSVTFAWRNQGTVLSIHPIVPLPYDSGAFGAGVTALEYAFQLSTAARDLAGSSLEAPLDVTFTVQREITQVFEVVKDRNVTGNYRSDDNYGILGCERVDTTICVGDSLGTGVELTYRGFLSFDVSALPASHTSISAAALDLPISFLVGTPSSGLGTLEVERVDVPSINLAAMDAPGLTQVGTLPNDGVAGDVLSMNVLSSLATPFNAGRLQYRLHFTINTNGNLASDLVVFDWSAPRLSLTYRIP
jgi:Big-like domain-containing protein